VWALEEAGAEYQHVKIDLFKGEGHAPAYLEINPSGKVPALIDGGFILTESAAIVTYIGDQYPESQLTPPVGTQKRGHYDQWCYFAVTELEQPLWTIAKHRFALPEEWRVPAVIDTAYKEFQVAAKVLETGLGDKLFILGEQFSAADILLALILGWARKVEALPESAILSAYLERCLARPALQRARQREA
jgi:glutathione S-transferase